MKRYLAIAAGLVVAGLLFARGSWADVAPPQPGQGSNIAPGESTQVRMVAEQVFVDVVMREPQPRVDFSPLDDLNFFWGQLTAPAEDCYHEDSTIPYCRADDFDTAHVQAHFQMRNLGEETESMHALFPLMSKYSHPGMPEIQNLRVWVDGQEVPTHRVETPNPIWSNSVIPWAAFPVTFPPGADVQVDVTYDFLPSGDSIWHGVEYIFETGAGWKDTIGDAVLTFRLPYAITEQNARFPQGLTYQVQGNEAKFHWQDWEPTDRDNWFASILNPVIWQHLLQARARTTDNPNDARAWEQRAWAAWWASLDGKGRYYGLSNEGGFRDGDPTLISAREAIMAYEKAAALAPNDPDIQASYIAFRMANELSWDRNLNQVSGLRMKRLVDDFAARFPAHPAIPQLREMLEHVIPPPPTPTPTVTIPPFILPDMRVAAAPTSTPKPTSTPNSTPTPNPTPNPTSTPAPSPTPTTIPTPSPNPSPKPTPSPSPNSTPIPTILLLAGLALLTGLAIRVWKK